jgi:2-methylisocitrate lyase-like PEP mutase family enzyme
MANEGQHERARQFRALHDSGSFIIPNCFDGGSARVLGGLGFKALATSSAAAAATYGRLDGQISREEALAHARLICHATSLPVSADLENGFGTTPRDAALTIEMAGEAGAVGGSIEDTSGNAEKPILDFALSVERIAAAVEAARKMPFPFTLTARTENFLNGIDNLDDTIRRLQAFEKAGADVLFAPGLPTLDAVRQVCAALTRPVNFMVAIPGRSFSVAELAAAGVRRISLATTMYRAAMGGVASAAADILATGRFDYLGRIMPGSTLDKYLAG